MHEALKALMDKLEVVGALHPELYDTAVREQLAGAMFNGFVRPKESWSPSDQSFGMFSEDGNDAVRQVVAEFLEVVGPQGVALTSDERMKAIWNYESTGPRSGTAYRLSATLARHEDQARVRDRDRNGVRRRDGRRTMTSLCLPGSTRPRQRRGNVTEPAALGDLAPPTTRPWSLLPSG